MIRKNVIIKHLFGIGDTIFQRDMSLKFAPDQMKVKYLLFIHGGKGVIPLLIKCSIVNDYIGACCDNGQTQQINTIFDIKRPIQGLHDFTFHDINGDLLTTQQGKLYIHLEFIKNKI